MDKIFGYTGLGLWFGITSPFFIMWMASHLSPNHIPSMQRPLKSQRVVRLILGPSFLIGLIGLASVVGQTEGASKYFSIGALLGLLVYGVYLWSRGFKHS